MDDGARVVSGFARNPDEFLGLRMKEARESCKGERESENEKGARRLKF